MNENIQNEINAIIEENHKRIGGRAARKQAQIAKHQITTLTELGLIDYMPNAPYSRYIGYSDAKAVIEAAQDAGGKVYVSNYDDVSKSEASNLYQLLNAPVEEETEDYTVIIDGDGGSQNMAGGVQAYHLGTTANIWQEDGEWWSCLSGVGEGGNYFETDNYGPFQDAKEAEAYARDMAETE